MNAFLKYTKRFCGYAVGFVFFFSGIFKLLDPVGAGLVMEEYYRFLHLGFLDFSALGTAVVFAFVETMIGALLITGLWRRITAIITFAFLGFFTLLTLALVIFNPVMDCGCFGEVVHLTHLQTFIKNIVLLALCCASFLPFSQLGIPKKRKFVSFALVASAVLAFTVYSLIYIPLIDFTDYRSGARLAAAEHPFGPEQDAEAYEAVFLYEKDGNTLEFSLDNLPDSTWNYVSTETRRKEDSSNAETVITLPLMDEQGNSQDDIAAEGKIMAVSMYRPESASHARWKKVTRFLRHASEQGYRPLLALSAQPGALLGMLPQDISLEDQAFLESISCYSDYKALISLNRNNGGAALFNDGYLIRKWASVNLPDQEELMELSAADTTETLLASKTNGNLAFQAFLLYVFAVLLLL